MAIKKTSRTAKPKAKSVDLETVLTKNLPFKRSEKFMSIYANTSGFGHTKFDFQVSLGRVDATRDPDYKYAEELAILTMTPEFAKALLMDYARHIAIYEEEFGEIVLRPHLLANMGVPNTPVLPED